VTTYAGKYYQVQGAFLNPRPVSTPRPVLNIAAHGPRALRLAAKYGDAWNTLSPGQDLTPKQHSDNTRQRWEMLQEFLAEEGRDPDRIGRTMLFGWTADAPFRSLDAFYDAVGRYQEAGINDFAFIFYDEGLEEWKDQAITRRDLLERIALDAIPAITGKVRT